VRGCCQGVRGVGDSKLVLELEQGELRLTTRLLVGQRFQHAKGGDPHLSIATRSGK
jgi:hypothetical protein